MLHIIIGLPGSGKTRYATQLLLKGFKADLYDEFLYGRPPARDGAGMENLISSVRDGRNAIACDTNLCPRTNQLQLSYMIDRYKGPRYPARWVYFANTPESCSRNVERHYQDEIARHPKERFTALLVRDRRLALVEKLSFSYFIPDGIECIPVAV